MENPCNVNQLDADVLLPPRKRLLAGLKKQSSDGDVAASPSLFAASSVTASEASKIAAIAAAKVAEAARAAAEEKAAKAAKAIAAAKNALELVASFPEEATSKDKYLKRNKLPKHLPVQLLYKKYQPVENCRTDEELARKLHRAMNSSPRISKDSPESKGNKHKRPKSCSSFEITEGSDTQVALGQDCLSLCNGHVAAGKIDCEGSIQEVCSNKEDKKGGRFDKSSQMEIRNGEAESSQSKEKNCEDSSPTGKKRGRVKLKKLPLSICTSKDKAQPKEELKARSPPSTEMNTGNHPASNLPLFPVEPPVADRVMPIEATSMWKCQELKPPACMKQNKVVQS
ncbi:hypothetical protein L6164_020262 [Bauhinia variegata]|uniref:Uncharacterized protein n=1 Tax=Bauhinia variegata TaxID=167791 RepID=A0ACB9MUV8_BAUVA|nr:hypothetical protein L6164_020262 [Bauhinia variegata]